MPHVLAYYAIFFGFGALMFGVPGAAKRLGRGWWFCLPLALLLAPVALALALQMPWGREFAGDEHTRRVLSSLGQVLYVWLMIFGLMGLFQTLLSRERPSVRFISDSAYWLYLVHLPLVIAGQALLAGLNLPAWVKITLLIAATVAILLVSYRYLVRYTWLGRSLNGPRNRVRGSMA
jgi:peptidoglycan/LPS O-acetylase OafA/YrhL